MTDFGDHTDDDSFDTAAPDPEQVARKLQAIRYDRMLDTVRWDDVDIAGQTVRVAVVVELLQWGRREGWVR